MAKQQSKRRSKRYQPGSAYAGHVRPTGILSIVSSPRTMRVVFFVMALALAAGGLGGLVGTTALRGGNSGSNPAGFVDPKEDGSSGATPGASATAEARQYAAPPAMTIDTGRRYTATIKTELGDIQVELLDDQAPTTVNNFVFLARDGFYDGLTFHQVFPDFSAQAGDPTGRGDGGPGYELQQEAPGPFKAGTLGMVNGSQFFIALTGSERFQEFTPFGRVTSGLELAEQLAAGTKIESIEIQEG